MKKLLVLFLLTTLYTSAQEKKWRTLTFTSLSGVTFTGAYLQTVSMSLDYEIKNNWTISSWSGINYNTSYDGGWISTSAMIGKKFHGLNMNAGVMYGTGNINTPLPDQLISRDFSVVFSVSKRFKL
jgi:hypothetical protein